MFFPPPSSLKQQTKNVVILCYSHTLTHTKNINSISKIIICICSQKDDFLFPKNIFISTIKNPVNCVTKKLPTVHLKNCI